MGDDIKLISHIFNFIKNVFSNNTPILNRSFDGDIGYDLPA